MLKYLFIIFFIISTVSNFTFANSISGSELKKIVNKEVSDNLYNNAQKKFPINTPLNKEEFYYRNIFESFFPSNSAAQTVPSEPSVACSSEIALKWDASFSGKNDPSGRSVNSHQNNYLKI